MNRVLIAGGTGVIGKHLTAFLETKNLDVSVLTRNKKLADGKKFFYWNLDDIEIDEKCFSNVDYIIQLSGSNISEKRWTTKRKLEILNSRVNATNLLFQSIKSTGIKLKAFISASAIGYYGSKTSNHIYSENDLPGNDFLANTCLKWEESANRFTEIGIRTVLIRTGIVLIQNGGVLQKLITPAKFGFAATLGNGNQYFPWIHINDLCEIYFKAICDEKMNGAYNAVSPTETTNKIFTETLCRVMHKPKFLPNIPAVLLKIIFGELASTFLNGSRISAKKIMNSGFEFQFDDLDMALKNLVRD